MRRLAALAGAFACGVASTPLTASANPLDFTLGASNLGPGFAAPFGTVQVTLLDSTDAQLTFTSNLAGGYIFVDGGAAGANFNGPVIWTAVSCNSPSTLCGSDGGTGNEDGFGQFSNTWNLQNAGSGNRASEIVLKATLTTGTWSSESDVLTNNSSNYLLAAHIGAGNCSTLETCNSVDLRATGFAGNGSILPPPPPETVPEPISLALFGAGLTGLGYLRHRRR